MYGGRSEICWSGRGGGGDCGKIASLKVCTLKKEGKFAKPVNVFVQNILTTLLLLFNIILSVNRDCNILHTSAYAHTLHKIAHYPYT